MSAKSIKSLNDKLISDGYETNVSYINYKYYIVVTKNDKTYMCIKDEAVWDDMNYDHAVIKWHDDKCYLKLFSDSNESIKFQLFSITDKVYVNNLIDAIIELDKKVNIGIFQHGIFDNNKTEDLMSNRRINFLECEYDMDDMDTYGDKLLIVIESSLDALEWKKHTIKKIKEKYNTILIYEPFNARYIRYINANDHGNSNSPIYNTFKYLFNINDDIANDDDGKYIDADVILAYTSIGFNPEY